MQVSGGSVGNPMLAIFIVVTIILVGHATDDRDRARASRNKSSVGQVGWITANRRQPGRCCCAAAGFARCLDSQDLNRSRLLRDHDRTSDAFTAEDDVPRMGPCSARNNPDHCRHGFTGRNGHARD